VENKRLGAAEVVGKASTRLVMTLNQGKDAQHRDALVLGKGGGATL